MAQQLPCAEIVVVGAGPAGASAAFHLARRGREVLLLERRRFPRDKSCGDGLTRSAVRLLDEIGVLDELSSSWRVGGVRAFMRGKGSRTFRYPSKGDLAQGGYGLVVPRQTLDAAIAQRAADAGAIVVQEAAASRLIVGGRAVRGVEALVEGKTQEIEARVVIAADGATSPLARQAGLVETPRERLGIALRAYFDRITGLTNLVEFFMPLLAPSTKSLLPSYGWVFPTGPDSANVGVGLFAREDGANVRELFAGFLHNLTENDPRFRQARQRGKWRGAPLRFDFAPERCWAPGLLLVGDAAGMISPFTGEGISYALESGKLAAELIDARLDSSDANAESDWSEYAAELARRHGGYFETGRHGARRYRWAWRVLESTFQSEQPLFALARRGALVPEGVGGIGSEDLLDDIGPLVANDLRVHGDLITVGELLADAVRREWPFLARLYASTSGQMMLSLRPSVLALIASRVGQRARADPAHVAAVVEFGALAAIAQASVEEEGGGESDSPNWGNMFAVMVSDVLLARSLALSVAQGMEVTEALTRSLERLCVGRARELQQSAPSERSADARLAMMGQTGLPALFCIACEAGALAGGASSRNLGALAEYGRELGLAYQLLDEAKRLDAGGDRLGRNPAADFDTDALSFPVWLALAGKGAGSRQLASILGGDRADRRRHASQIIALVRQCGALQETRTYARNQIELGLHALERLPQSPARQSLERVGLYVIDGVHRA